MALLNLGAVMKIAVAERAPQGGARGGSAGDGGDRARYDALFPGQRPDVGRIRAGERRFRDLFDNMNSGVAVLRPVNDGSDFVITDYNRAAERIDGLERKAVVGRPLTQVFPAARTVDCWVSSGGSRERSVRACSEVLYKDDRISGWRQHSVYGLPSGEVVTLYDDVTERKATEEQLREAQKLEVLGQLTQRRKHDFNNLLAIIIGNLQLWPSATR